MTYDELLTSMIYGDIPEQPIVVTLDELREIFLNLGVTPMLDGTRITGFTLPGRSDVWIAENLAAPPVNSVCTAAARAMLDRR